MIALHNLKKAWRGKPALHGLSFEVRKGEVFGLLGHNGAGKSTTLGILLGQVFPDEGEALIGGVSVQRERARALADTPPISASPSSGKTCPSRMPSVVLLPAPLCPSRPKTSPFRTSNESPWSAGFPRQAFFKL